MNTIEKIQLIEAMVKVVNANQKNSQSEMVTFANDKIKHLTKELTEQEPKNINLNEVENLLYLYSDGVMGEDNRESIKNRWRKAIGYTLNDLKK